MLNFNTWTPCGETDSRNNHGVHLLSKLAQLYTQVTSFNAKACPGGEGLNEFSGSLTFQITSEDRATKSFYGTGDSLVLSIETEFSDAEVRRSLKNTTLFKANVAANGNTVNTSFHSMVTLDGQWATVKHSLDLEGNDLRVATRSTNK
jgi:hypothetical protein